MSKRALLGVVVAVLAATGLSAGPASATQSPSNCGGNESDFRITRDPATPARPGDHVNFLIWIGNSGSNPCDITMTTPLTFNLPAANGTPTGAATILAPANFYYLAGSPFRLLMTVPYTVAVDPGVTDAVVQLQAMAALHDADKDHVVEILRTLGTDIIRPHMVLTKVASPVVGVAPLTVTYTYTLTNDGDTPIDTVTATDNRCSPLTRTGSSGNNDNVLDLKEVWTYTCTQTFNAPGVYPNVALANGKSTVDHRDVPAGPVNASVTVTAPPLVQNSPPPAVVQNVAAPVQAPALSTAPTCVELPKSLNVRARELTTVRVTVNSGAKGTKVTIKGPGINKSATTNSKGVAIFKVRATKTGTLTVTAPDNCVKASRVAVKAARRTQSKAIPKVTG